MIEMSYSSYYYDLLELCYLENYDVSEVGIDLSYAEERKRVLRELFNGKNKN